MNWMKVPGISVYKAMNYEIKKMYYSWECYYHQDGHIGTRKQDYIGDARTLKAAKELCEKHAENK